MRISTQLVFGFAVAMAGLAVFVAFMMVFDELYALAQYCGPLCTYPFPWSPPLGLWPAWVWAFVMICVGVLMLVIGSVAFAVAVWKLRSGER
jgi:hypothetical protein